MNYHNLFPALSNLSCSGNPAERPLMPDQTEMRAARWEDMQRMRTPCSFLQGMLQLSSRFLLQQGVSDLGLEKPSQICLQEASRRRTHS